MQESKNKRSLKSGLPPGSLVYVGKKITKITKISLFNYDQSHYEEKEIKTIKECTSYKNKPGITWINLEGLQDIKLIEELGTCFNIHPLALEDILNTEQRAKKDDFSDFIYVVLKMLSSDKNKTEIVSEQVSIVIGSNFLLSFQEGIEGDVFNSIREHIRKDKGNIRKLKIDYLVYSMLDSIVDNYFTVLENLNEKIGVLENTLIINPNSAELKQFHVIRKELIILRKSIWPLREVINSLIRDGSSLIGDTTKIYLRDVYDHTIEALETIDTYRDMTQSMAEIYFSNLNNKLNKTITALTIISTIFIPPTFIVGIYGMNFKHMPELEWKWGYPFVMFFMLVSSITMIAYFKQKKWI